MLRLLAGLLLLSLALNPVVAAQADDRVTPGRIDAVLQPGQCTDRTVTLSTGAAPVPRLDVALVMDVTSSMNEEIAAVQQRATEIVAQVKKLVPETRFAVATLADYPYVESKGGLLDMLGNLVEYGDTGDYPWRVESDFTTDASKIQAALDKITLLSGGDAPESYLRALSESRYLKWHPDARRIVVLFGDSYPHDPDPGPDTKLGTADDLSQTKVIESLTAAGISVISIYSTPQLASFYESISVATGGQTFALTVADNAPEAVVNLLKADVRTLRRVMLRPDPKYASWVTATPDVYDEVRGDSTVSWAVHICYPAGATADSHQFELAVSASGSRLHGIPVSIRSPAAWPPWLPFLGLIPLAGLLVFAIWRVTRRPPSRRIVAPPKPALRRPGSPLPPPAPPRPPAPSGKDIRHD